MISGKVDDKAIQRVETRLEQLRANLQQYQTQFVILLQQSIQAALVSKIGDKAKHFSVDIVPSGYDMKVKLVADEVGGYLYYGTQSHTIENRTGGTAMPIGGSKFARQVHHPGTAAMKDHIDGAVEEGILVAKAAMGSMRKRI